MSGLWPHQRHGLLESWRIIREPGSAVCITAPTGGGKTRMMCELIEEARYLSKGVSIYTNRILLTQQISRVLRSGSISHGIRASGFTPSFHEKVQVCSLATEHRRSLIKSDWKLHDASLVLVDEAHSQKAMMAQDIIRKHREAGASVVGFTATPIAIGHIYDDLVIAGVNSELRACGAHLPCVSYSPDMPDLRSISRNVIGEYNIGDIRKLIHQQTLVGRVIKWYNKLNPDRLPAILFAPGVAESKWFVDRFEENGVTAAHIDAKCIYIHGKEYKPTRDRRDELLERSRDGKINVLCNRFVLREGIDAPWLYHCIFATPFGALTSYLQAGGRLLRSHPSIDKVIVQDHGGNCYRHGSLNEDRAWDIGDDEFTITKKRKQVARDPITCPKCGLVRRGGKRCPLCGYQHEEDHRNVIMTDGSLKQMKASDFKKRRLIISKEEEAWMKCVQAGAFGKQARSTGNPRSMKQVANDYKRRTGKKLDSKEVRCLPPKDSDIWQGNARDYLPYIKEWKQSVTILE
jgi:DNA repair protein RadD